jgi:hypothetical protein
MEEEHQTITDAMWGYKDQHGNWSPGLTQRMGTVENRLNVLVGLVTLALLKTSWPDLVGIIAKTATIAAASMIK